MRWADHRWGGGIPELGADQKEKIAFGFKHTVCEGFITKVHLFNPESFCWDHAIWGVADGVVSSGIGTSYRVDWRVWVTPPFDETFKYASIKDSTCSQIASQGGGCNKCATSCTLLLRCCTQTANLCRKPLSQYINNNYLQQTPSLITRKTFVQAEVINALQSSYHGKLYRKWLQRDGVSVPMNKASN